MSQLTITQARAHASKHGYVLKEIPLVSGQRPTDQNDSTAILVRPNEPKPARGRQMNKTEAEFARILEAQKRKGEILDWVFEGIRLRWGDSMWYKPDFVVRRPRLFNLDHRLLLVEVKGAHIWDRDLVRFKGCRAEWKLAFEFVLWQKKAGTWTQLL